MSVVTTVSAFYLPASVMIILYYKVYDGLRQRARFGERAQRVKVRKARKSALNDTVQAFKNAPAWRE